MLARYAFSLVLANFGIAIAARMPMITTTIRSSIRVKPFLLLIMRLAPRGGCRPKAKGVPARSGSQCHYSQAPCQHVRPSLTRCAARLYTVLRSPGQVPGDRE